MVVAGRTGIAEIYPPALVAARRTARMTQQELATRIGYRTGDAISKYERGKHNPDVHVLARIAAALHVPIRSLLRPGVPHSLRVLRICAGLTQIDVADKLHMSRSTWGDIERGLRRLDDYDVGRVAQVLGVAAADVVSATSAEWPDGPAETAQLNASLIRRLERHRKPGESLDDELDRLIPE